jgi:hypothetical protein
VVGGNSESSAASRSAAEGLRPPARGVIPLLTTTVNAAQPRVDIGSSSEVQGSPGTASPKTRQSGYLQRQLYKLQE